MEIKKLLLRQFKEFRDLERKNKIFVQHLEIQDNDIAIKNKETNKLKGRIHRAKKILDRLMDNDFDEYTAQVDIGNAIKILHGRDGRGKRK